MKARPRIAVFATWLALGAAPSWVRAGTPAPSPAASPARAPEAARSTALFSLRGVAEGELLDALRMRMPDLELRTRWRLDELEPQVASQGGVGTVFVNIRADSSLVIAGQAAPGGVRVDIVLADGRAFRRELAARGDEARVVASFVANLLYSIEQDAEAEDRRNVELPRTNEQADMDTVAQELAETPTEPPPEPAPQAEPTARPLAPAPAPNSARIVRTSPWQAGLRTAGLATLGLAPRYVDVFVGAGASLGLDLRHHRGLLLVGEVRVLTKTGGLDQRLNRVRLSGGAGYEWRKGQLALPLAATLSLEPWLIRSAGVTLPPRDLGAPGALMGAALRFDPSYRIAAPRLGSDGAVRLGLRVEMAASFVVDAGPRTVALNDANDDPAFQAGGFETSFGLLAGFDFGPRWLDR